MSKFIYIFGGCNHSNTTNEYMVKLGMNEEQIESTIRQARFESEQLKSVCVKWRDGKLKAIVDRIDQYERDSIIDEQYKTTKVTHEQYLLLLADRKLLCDYPQLVLFPYCDKPLLNTEL